MMLKKSFETRIEVERFFDMLIALVSLTLAILIRRDILIKWRPDLFPVFDFWPEAGWLYIALLFIWTSLFNNFDLYARRTTRTPGNTLLILLKVSLIGIMLAFFMFYILKIKNIPRFLILLYAGLDFTLMFVKEVVLRSLEKRYALRPNILLLGQPGEFEEFLGRLRKLPHLNPHLVGMVQLKESGARENGTSTVDMLDLPSLGSLDDLARILHEQSIDFVVMNPIRERFSQIQTAVTTCETEGVEIWMIAGFFNTSIARAQVDEFYGLPMVTFKTTPGLHWTLMVKRGLDIIGSLALILLTLPAMILAALVIKLGSPGPILFSQVRCTLHGRQFTMHKFRTMVSDAENLRDELLEDNEVDGPVFKIKEDPRITRAGRFLRKHSLDELPQLFNVLAGDMSLVGPRPPLPSEVQQYQNWQRRRLSMHSGLTCLWQVSGRNQLDFDDWMRLDLKYIDDWSLRLDLGILLKTPIAVIRGTGY